MKHNVKITLFLLLMFLLAQFIGLMIIYNYIDFQKTKELGKTAFEELPIGERPPEDTGYIYILIAVVIGTLILLFFIKYQLIWIWKGWFILATLMGLAIAFGAFVPFHIAIVPALILAFWKVLKPNLWVQFGTELFVYGGLAAIFVPSLNLLYMSIILVLIALYDAYAVWKSKHMITLAKSQSKAKIFAGFILPYRKAEKKAESKVSGKKVPGGKAMVKVRMAMLGGGDIAFPLLFAGVVMKEMGLWQSLVIPFFAAGALGLLFWLSKEKKFYPAMPFISAGCFLALGAVWLIGLMI